MEPEVNTLKKVKLNFEAGYEMLPAKYQAVVRMSIMEKCGWQSLMTFHGKRKGDTPIRPPEVHIIEEEFAKHNINPWTGERTA